MKLRSLLSALLMCLMVFGVVVGLGTVAFSKSDLQVFSAIAMTEALQEIKPLFERANPAVNVLHNFGGSGQLRQQIERGAPADVFLSADQKDMDRLQQSDLLLPDTRRNLVRNQIVLVIPLNTTGITRLQDLTRPEVKRVAIGNPDTVPIGRYSQEIFRNLNLTNALRPKLVFGNSVRQVLSYVATGNVDAALVWVTDARTSDRIRVVQRIPPSLHSPALFPVSAIKESRNVQTARTYVQFLTTPPAKAVFEKYGFIPVF